MNTLYILRGYPGSGKTTLGKAMQSENLGAFIDHNQILNFVAKAVGNDDGIYGDIRVFELALTRKLLNDGKNTIVARGFSNPADINPYIELARSVDARIVILRLHAPNDVLVERVQVVERKSDFNPTVNEVALTTWITENPLIDIDHENILDSTLPVKTLVSQIVRLQ